MECIFTNAFLENSVFLNQVEIIEKLIDGLTPYLKRPDDIIIRIGEKPMNFYFISEGQCQVSLKDHFGDEVVIQK